MTQVNYARFSTDGKKPDIKAGPENYENIVPKKLKFSAFSRNPDREYKIEADTMKNYTDFDQKPFE